MSRVAATIILLARSSSRAPILGSVRSAIVVGAVVSAACSTQSAAPPPPPVAVADAGVDGMTAIGRFDPSSGMLLDDDGMPIPRVVPSRPKNRPPRPLDIMLKSSPSGALAAVDGEPVGVTPTYWFGEADGREHEFTFTRRGYAAARYKFVPITSGVVHATLEAVAVDPTDGGLGPLISPSFAPDASMVAPPTVSPDAAVRPAPGSGGMGPQP